MKTKVEQINNEIREKEERLLQKANIFFSSINIPNAAKPDIYEHKQVGNPPISYILYGVAGVAFLGGLVTNSESFFSRLLYFGVAGLSAYGGYNISSNKAGQKRPTSNNTFSPMSLKDDVAEKVTKYKKDLGNDWESFISIKQNDLQNYIMTNISDTKEQNDKIAKIYTHEIIDISISDFVFKANALPEDANLNNALKTLLDDYKKKVEDAIKLAVKKQTERYNSLV